MSNWRLIETIEALNKVVVELADASVLGIDTETTGLDPHTSKLRLIQIAVDHKSTVILDCNKVLPEGVEHINRIVHSSAVKVFQNAKFDLKFLRAAGINVSGKLFDTMLAGQLLRSSGGVRKVGLASLAEHYLDETVSKEEQTSDFGGDLTTSQLDYAAKDAEILLRLRNVMIPALKKNDLIEVARLEFACVYAIASMEYDGIHIDLMKWTDLTKTVIKEQEEAMTQLYPYIGYPTVQMGFFEEETVGGFNLNSNKQVLKLLLDHGIEVKNTSRYALSDYLNHPLVEQLLKYRHATKALNTFLYTIPEQINPVTHRLHPGYGQNGAYSGRMSCGNPNIQQIPREKRFRECFTAPEGRKLVVADYSQVELRVIAQFTGDQRMMQAYMENEDLHKLTASLVLQKEIEDITKSERQAAKAVNFGLVFGMGASGLKSYAADTYGTEMSMMEAELFKDRYFKGYKGVDRWHKEIKRTMPKELRSLAGRKYYFGSEAGLSGRFNTPIQGTAADILKNALGMLYTALKGTETRIVAVIHDEIILECPEEASEEMAVLLREIMESSGDRYLKEVPVVAEASIADSWAGK